MKQGMAFPLGTLEIKSDCHECLRLIREIDLVYQEVIVYRNARADVLALTIWEFALQETQAKLIGHIWRHREQKP